MTTWELVGLYAVFMVWCAVQTLLLTLSTEWVLQYLGRRARTLDERSRLQEPQ